MSKVRTKNSRSAKKRPKRSFILILGLILIIGSFTITIVGKQLEIREKKQEKAQKQEALQQQQRENDYLNSVLQNDDKSSFLEQEARKRGYGYPNEKVFYDITPGE